MMPLLFAPIGEEVEIKRISGSQEVKQHLADLGFNVGGKCRVVSQLNGNLIVAVKESRIALDRSLAEKISV